MANTRPSSRAEAQRLVKSIADDRCPIADEVLDRMSDADRRQVEHAILMKDQVNGPSVLTYVMAPADSWYSVLERNLLGARCA